MPRGPKKVCRRTERHYLLLADADGSAAVSGKTEGSPAGASVLRAAVRTHNPFSSLSAHIRSAVPIQVMAFSAKGDLANQMSITKETEQKSRRLSPAWRFFTRSDLLRPVTSVCKTKMPKTPK